MQQMAFSDQSSQNDVDLIGKILQMTQGASMAPIKQREGELSNQLLEAQVRDLPALSKSKQRTAEIGAASDFASGMSYASPELRDPAIAKVLEEMNLYSPDPEAKLKQLAESRGMTLDQLKQFMQQLQPKK